MHIFVLSSRSCWNRVCTSFGIEESPGGDGDSVDPEHPTGRGDCELVPLKDSTVKMFRNQSSWQNLDSLKISMYLKKHVLSFHYIVNSH